MRMPRPRPEGCIRRGGLKGGGGGVWLGAPSSQGLRMVPAEGGQKILKRKSSWHRRRRSKLLAVSLNHWKERGRRGGGGGTPPLPPAVYGRSNASLPRPLTLAQRECEVLVCLLLLLATPQRNTGLPLPPFAQPKHVRTHRGSE